MLLHLLLFRPRATLSAPDRLRLGEALSAAMHQIPGVRRVRVGRRVTHGRPYEQLMRTDYTHVAMLEFDDLDGLKSYLEHPAHDQLATRFFDAFEEALMYDYEVGEGDAGIRSLTTV